MKSLPDKPDRRKTYYKITNKEECHNGLQYHDGLVIDPKPFNNDPKASCVKGGIYFTTKEHLYKFFKYGCWIRPLRIPKDAKVVRDPTGDKYRANKLCFLPRKPMGFYFNTLSDNKTLHRKEYWWLVNSCPECFDIWFDKKTFPKHEYWRLAMYCSKHFDKWFDKKCIQIHVYRYLARYCPKYFNKWFDKKTFPKEDYWSLVKHCPEYFNKWFDKKTFPKKDYWRLAKYCSAYKDKWG